MVPEIYFLCLVKIGSVTAKILLTLKLLWYFYGWPGGRVGGRVAGWVGGWVAGLIGNIAISAQLELELGLSLAKLIRVTAKNEALEISFQMKLKTNISKSN